MIFLHLLLAIILGHFFGYTIWFIIGSIFPDIDHIYIMLKNKLWNPRKYIDSIRFEKKYNIKYKTPLFHSLLGAIIFSLPILVFSKTAALIFFISYLLHLIVDWLDIDDKYYLYPAKIRFKGFLQVWSKTEQIITLIILIVIFILRMA